MQRRTLVILLTLVPIVGIVLTFSAGFLPTSLSGHLGSSTWFSPWVPTSTTVADDEFAVNVDEDYSLESSFQDIGMDELTGAWKGKETKWLRGIPGYMMFENLYVENGIFYAITPTPEDLPPLTKFLSDMTAGVEGNWFPVADERRWVSLTPDEAQEKWKSTDSPSVVKMAGALPGTTFFMNDGPGGEGYLAHYFHFAAEILTGAFRVLASSPSILARGTTKGMEFPRRIILAKGRDWRDVPKINAWMIDTMFPMSGMEDSEMWNDRTASGNLYIFPQIVIVDRWASHRWNPTTNAWNKMNADVFNLIKGTVDWWAPIRSSMMRTLGIKPVEHNKDKTVVLYISRQNAAKRRLSPEAHEELLIALESLQPNIELIVAQMEIMSKKEQMEVVSRADVMMAVHGNGLTHAIWMRPGGAVIEIFDVGGFTRDYQILTEAFKHRYYPIWDNEVYDWKADVPGFKLTDNFQGTNITVDPQLIKGIIQGVMNDGNVAHLPTSDEL